MEGTVATVLVQGLEVAPWAVSAKLTDLGFAADVRVKLRPAVMGHLAVLVLLRWRGEEVNSVLSAGNPEAVAALARLLEYLAKRAYGVQFVLGAPDQESVDGPCPQIAPGQIGQVLQDFYTRGQGMAFITTAKARPHPLMV